MTERERLIELLETRHFLTAETTADFLLDNGVRLPVTCGECEHYCLRDAAELVEQLRSETHFVFGDYEGGFALPTQKELKAADFIERLVSKCNQLAEENAKLKAERDAYVQLFSKTDVWKCPFCAHNRQPHRTAFADCDVAGECKNTDALPTHFELRGVKEADDAD